jgi:hypothetical protein
LNILHRIRERISRWLCPGLLFNSDMSRELDRLLVENERLRELLGVGNHE